ncbi:MAG: sensor histidine kinase [Microcoleaceae cyanobacterium]
MRQTLKKWLSNLNVGQKIGLGYALSVGIAVSGAIIGIVVGNYYQQQAQQREEWAHEELALLSRLQSGVLQARTHQQQLIPLAQYPDQFQDEYAHILDHEAEIYETLAELNAFITESRQLVGDTPTQIPAFLQTYNHVPKDYFQEVNQRVEQIQNLNPTLSNEVEQAQKLMLEFTNSDLALKFDGISDDLVSLVDAAQQHLEGADREQIKAEELIQKIMIASMVLSTAIAALLASLIIRAITQPIAALTSVAKQSTEESNFDLQATVEQDDEIGMLAQAFNQLIHSVKQLLQQQQVAKEQLETYSQSLESKIVERNQLLEELQRAQVQMVQSEKMSALGQMVAGIAHEINNPVNFIHGNLTHIQEYTDNLLDFVQLYQDHYPDPGPEIEAGAEELDIEFIQADLSKVLDSMKMGTGRIRQIVLSLRNFSRLDEADFKAVDLHEGIDSTLLILQHRLKETSDHPAIQVRREYGSLPPVECYPSQLNQALMNILVNATDALEEANAKRTNQQIKEDPSQIRIQTSRIDENWVKIVISDNGVGIPELVRQRIFDPFFTTKAIGKGTGLGMSISHQIVVEKHGGTLECCSVQGKGTEFILKIPIQQQTHDEV